MKKIFLFIISCFLVLFSFSQHPVIWSAKHRIKILFTIFDDCWNPDAKTGKQPDPKPGVHNSGWVRRIWRT